MIGVSRTTVGRKERGANVDQAFLQAAAKAYDCDPTDFFKPPQWLVPKPLDNVESAARAFFDTYGERADMVIEAILKLRKKITAVQ
jgi:transcriptional regulator with XRE-family HTH domain